MTMTDVPPGWCAAMTGMRSSEKLLSGFHPHMLSNMSRVTSLVPCAE
jgi:hypothetical protein